MILQLIQVMQQLYLNLKDHTGKNINPAVELGTKSPKPTVVVVTIQK